MFRKQSLVYRCKSFQEKKKNKSHKTANRKTRTASAEENVTYRLRNAFLTVAY